MSRFNVIQLMSHAIATVSSEVNVVEAAGK
jgi:hypothetical protein